jgi:hypothetical protein
MNEIQHCARKYVAWILAMILICFAGYFERAQACEGSSHSKDSVHHWNDDYDHSLRLRFSELWEKLKESDKAKSKSRFALSDHNIVPQKDGVNLKK